MFKDINQRIKEENVSSTSIIIVTSLEEREREKKGVSLIHKWINGVSQNLFFVSI